MKRVAIYARVSTRDQNPESQVLELREFAKRRGFTITKVYVDHVTGNIDRRRREKSTKDQAYQQLMVDARLRKFDAVLVWRFDRFARSITALIEGLKEFQALGIDFVSQTEDVDTTTPMGRLFFHIVGAFAEFERELIVERVNAGLDNARANGVRLGRPRLSGEDEILQLHAKGGTLGTIAGATGRSKTGVRKVLMRAGKYKPRRPPCDRATEAKVIKLAKRVPRLTLAAIARGAGNSITGVRDILIRTGHYADRQMK